MARIGDYQSAPDADPATWVVEGLRGFAESVLSLVPAGFEAYARIFHPAWTYEPEAPVRWRDIAEANGRTAHRMMQWHLRRRHARVHRRTCRSPGPGGGDRSTRRWRHLGE